MINFTISSNSENIDLGYGKLNLLGFLVATIAFGLIGLFFLYDYLVIGFVSNEIFLLSQIFALLMLLMFTMAGISKLLQIEQMKTNWVFYGYPIWVMTLTGILELTGALLLIFGLILDPIFLMIGGLFLTSIMVGALGTHLIRTRDNAWLPALFLFSFSGYIGLINLLNII